MTQLDLATKLGVTDRAVSKWENGRGLPDLSLITPLCDALSISVNELLKGERIHEQEILSVANENIITTLSEREKEIKKRRQSTVLAVVLAVITAFFGILYGPMFGERLLAQLRGEGHSFSSAYYTRKAEQVAEYIDKGKFDKAVQLIGFYTEDLEATQSQWCKFMEELDDAIRIEKVLVSDMYEHEYAVFGYTTLIVYDYESNRRFVFEIKIGAQNGGIAFSRIIGLDDSDREGEVGRLINKALPTWDAG
ncbi:MAG: helix-turn-helix transcriptional regulator [Clostridia bacterium]|nr:helix-turn-helix transcriptional regulator [Clostridia bacterium]